MNKMHLTLSVLFFALHVGLFSPQPVEAMVVRGGETFLLEAYTTLEDDLYVGGKTLTFAGTTTGDIFAVGSEVTQSGYVSEDALLAGGIVTISGTVEGDLRVVGGKILFSGHVTEDLVLIGGTITISKDAVIEGDLLVLGDHLTSEGTVHGIAEVYTRIAEFTGGTIDGSLRAYTRESLAVKGDTHIVGDLEHKAPNNAVLSETATIDGETVYTKLETTESKKGSIDLVELVKLALIVIVSALTLVFFFPAHTRAMTDIALSKSNVMHFLKGLLILIATPFVVVLVGITVVGIIPSVTILFVYLALLLVACALAPVLAGVLLARWLKKQDEELSYAWVSLGAIMFALLALLPYVGFIVQLMVFLLALYAVSVLLYEHVWVQRKKQQLEAEKKPQYETKETRDKEETTTNA